MSDSRSIFRSCDLRTQPAERPVHTLTGKLKSNVLFWQIRSWSERRCGLAILLDAAATGEFGGTGKSIDWSLMPQLQALTDTPLALAGGLNSSNVAQAIETAQTHIVDVASGVESPKGVKCVDEVRRIRGGGSAGSGLASS